MNRELSHTREIYPSLLEVERAAAWYASSPSSSLEELKKQEWLWTQVSCLGKLAAPFFSKTLFWKERYLLPAVLRASLLHLDRMNKGDFRRHEEEKLFALAAFVKKEAKNAPLPHSMAGHEFVERLLQEAPSFEKRKELFRQRCQREGLSGESCVWYRNETLSQYTKRMEERLQATCARDDHKVQRKSLSRAHVSLPVQQGPLPFVLSEKVRQSFFSLKERLLGLHDQLDEMKHQIKGLKHKACLFRAEDETLFREVRLLEARLLNIALLFEEIISCIPESGLSSLFETEKEAEGALFEYTREVREEEQEIARIQKSLSEQESKLLFLKKNITSSLQTLSKKISRAELLAPGTSFGAIQGRLLSQARHAIEEYRKGMTKAPGLLFSISRLEAYVEDIMTLCLSFFQKGKSQEALDQKLTEIEKSISNMVAEDEEKEKKIKELSCALQRVRGLYASDMEREKCLATVMTLYEEMKNK